MRRQLGPLAVGAAAVVMRVGGGMSMTRPSGRTAYLSTGAGFTGTTVDGTAVDTPTWAATGRRTAGRGGDTRGHDHA